MPAKKDQTPPDLRYFQQSSRRVPSMVLLRRRAVAPTVIGAIAVQPALAPAHDWVRGAAARIAVAAVTVPGLCGSDRAAGSGAGCTRRTATTTQAWRHLPSAVHLDKAI